MLSRSDIVVSAADRRTRLRSNIRMRPKQRQRTVVVMPELSELQPRGEMPLLLPTLSLLSLLASVTPMSTAKVSCVTH